MGIMGKFEHMMSVRQKENEYKQQDRNRTEQQIKIGEQLFLEMNIAGLEKHILEAIEYKRFTGILRNTVIVKANTPHDIVDNTNGGLTYDMHREFNEKFNNNKGYCLHLLEKVATEVKRRHPEWRITSKLKVPNSSIYFSEQGWVVHVV